MDFQALRSARLELREKFARHPQYEYLAVAVFMALLGLVAHGNALNGSWRWDDGAHLNFAAHLSPWQYFFDPDIARRYSSANVAPWNLLFYDINLSLFGMNTVGHYAHLLFIVVLGAMLFYAVLRQWLPPLPAMLGAIALLLGKPTFHIAAGLMHGHYATGFALAMLAILGWIRYLRGGRWYWLALSVFAYLLATTCKEVYVPLVVLLPFLPTGTLRQRARALLPFVLVAAAYTGWRYLILGAFFGGYSQGQGFDFANAMHQLSRIPRLLVGSELPGIALALSFIGLLGLAFVRGRLNWPLLAVAFAIVFLPLLPLTSFPGIHKADRYLFIPWVALSSCLAALLPRHTRSIATITLPVLIILAIIATHEQERKDTKQDILFWDTAYRFAISADKTQQAIFVGPDDGYKRLMLTGARKTADLLEPDAAPGKLQIVDESGNGRLLHIKTNNMQIFEFIEGKISSLSKEKIIEKFPQYPHLKFNADLPLEVDMISKAGVLNWNFGPYDGHYVVNIFSVSRLPDTEFLLPRKGSIHWNERGLFRISFCYTNTRENINACSPILNFDFSATERATWHGISQTPAAQ